MKTRVIVPLDGSEPAERSLNCLGFLKSIPDAEICLVRVRDARVEHPTVDEVQAYLSLRAADLQASLGLPVTTRVTHGMPFLAILEEAEMEDVSMIVMTTHGRTDSARHGVGSVTDRIARYAPCPTLVICPSCTVGAIDTLIVPLDGSRLAEEAVPVAAALAQALDLPIELVTVVPSEPDAVTSGDNVAAREARAMERLSHVKSQLPPAIEVVEAVRKGPVIETLIGELKGHPRSLLVMASHGGEGFRSYALGRVSDQVLLDTPVPVLLVQSGHGRRLERAFNA